MSTPPGQNINPVHARIGMVNFINTAPICHVWNRRVRKAEWLVVERVPAELNRMLHNGELDLGFISSHEYAVNPAEYMILDNLSISATGKVGSVCLFSRYSPHDLSGKRVLLSSQSQTSASLAKIVLEDFFGVKPCYACGTVSVRTYDDHAVDAVLAIGDEALRLAGAGCFSHVLDLSRCWQEKTGLPFVFAVWAVRRDFCRRHPDTVIAVHDELLGCLAEGRRDLAAISQLVAEKIPMASDECYRYLCGIEYDFDVNKKRALALFFQYLIRRREAPASALPLAMFP